MNCKPGDLAVIVLGRHKGWLVHVLDRTPKGDFFLPDGWPAKGETHGELPSWTCETAGSRFDARTTEGPRKARYAVIADYGLRPIRDPGEDARDETLNWLPVPVKEVA